VIPNHDKPRQKLTLQDLYVLLVVVAYAVFMTLLTTGRLSSGCGG